MQKRIESINILFLLSLAVVSWVILCYIKYIEDRRADFLHESPSLEQIGKNDAREESNRRTNILQTIGGGGSLDTCLNFLCIFACIYMLTKLTQVSERYVARIMQEKIKTVATDCLGPRPSRNACGQKKAPASVEEQSQTDAQGQSDDAVQTNEPPLRRENATSTETSAPEAESPLIEDLPSEEESELFGAEEPTTDAEPQATTEPGRSGKLPRLGRLRRLKKSQKRRQPVLFDLPPSDKDLGDGDSMNTLESYRSQHDQLKEHVEFMEKQNAELKAKLQHLSNIVAARKTARAAKAAAAESHRFDRFNLLLDDFLVKQRTPLYNGKSGVEIPATVVPDTFHSFSIEKPIPVQLPMPTISITTPSLIPAQQTFMHSTLKVALCNWIPDTCAVNFANYPVGHGMGDGAASTPDPPELFSPMERGMWHS